MSCETHRQEALQAVAKAYPNLDLSAKELEEIFREGKSSVGETGLIHQQLEEARWRLLDDACDEDEKFLDISQGKDTDPVVMDRWARYIRNNKDGFSIHCIRFANQYHNETLDNLAEALLEFFGESNVREMRRRKREN